MGEGKKKKLQIVNEIIPFEEFRLCLSWEDRKKERKENGINEKEKPFFFHSNTKGNIIEL